MERKPFNNCSICSVFNTCSRINFKHNEEHCKWHFEEKARATTDDEKSIEELYIAKEKIIEELYTAKAESLGFISPIIEIDKVLGTIENLINEVE